MTSTQPSPHSAAAILDQVEARGYVGRFRVGDTTAGLTVWCGICRRHADVDEVQPAETWRIDGAAEGGGDAYVIAFDCPECGTSGALSGSIGPGSSDAEVAVLTAIERATTRRGGRQIGSA